MRDGKVRNCGRSDVEASAISNIAIVVISHRLRSTLHDILRLICVRSDYQVYLICTAGPGLRPNYPGVVTLTPPHPMEVGEARVFAAQTIQANYLAFLDDDCVPSHTWLDSLATCIAEKPKAAMFFGPRQEVSCGSLAGMVRTLESASSRKRLWQNLMRSESIVPTTRLGPACAGGNMVINKSLVEATDLFDRDFMGCGFEDVDLQLRLVAEDLPVYFVPGLSVHHKDALSVHDLVVKSFKSGRGISMSKRKHGDMFRDISRWSSRTKILRTSTFCWIWLPATVVASPLFVFIALAIAEAIWAYRISRDLRSVAAWFTIKPVRDVCILAAEAVADRAVFKARCASDDKINA